MWGISRTDNGLKCLKKKNFAIRCKFFLQTREKEVCLHFSKKYRKKNCLKSEILGIIKIRDGKCFGYVICSNISLLLIVMSVHFVSYLGRDTFMGQIYEDKSYRILTRWILIHINSLYSINTWDVHSSNDYKINVRYNHFL